MSAGDDTRLEQLERRVLHLEAELAEMRGSIGPGSIAPTASPATPPPPRPSSGPPGPQYPPPVGLQPSSLPPPPTGPPSPHGQLTGPPIGSVQPRRTQPIAIDSEAALKWGGVGLVVLAIGFAVSTAISRGWIGPELQLLGAFAASCALVAAGLWLEQTRPAWTHALCSGGVAALFATVASNLFLDQASDDIAYATTVVIGLAAFALARFIPSQWVAVVAALGGVVVWFVIADGEPPFTETWLWTVALVAISLTLSLEMRWCALRLLAQVVGLGVILGLANDAFGGSQAALTLIGAVALCGSLVALPSRGDLTSLWQKLEIQLVTVTAPWALLVGVVALDIEADTAIGLIGIGIAAVFAYLAFGVRRWIVRAHVVSLLISSSVVLSIGMAYLLSATTTFVALAVQGAGLVVLGRTFGNDPRTLVNAAIVSLVAGTYMTSSTLDAWTIDAPIADDIANLAIIALLALAGWLTDERQIRQVTAVGLLVLVLTWLGSVLVHLPQGQAVVSVSWAVVGIGVFIAGAVRKEPELGMAGLGVIALTVAKLLTVDLQEVDTLWRAGLFFVVGLGIMRLGFLIPRLTDTTAEVGSA